MEEKNKLVEVAKVFFKLGLFAFGGPAAHIAMMEDEVVEKRKWMTREHFLDLIGATNLIPGPNSTEMTMHCGHERAGTKGLFVAGASFIFPAVVMTGLLAYLYVEYGELPEVKPFIVGIKPAVLAVIAAAILKLGKKALKTWELGIIGAGTLILCILGVNEVYALLGTGIVGGTILFFKNKLTFYSKSILPFALLNISGVSLIKLSTTKVFLIFLKVGAVLYGSGYVLFAYLDAELVETGLLSRQELLDAIAVGQFTPGPVLSTATFIGYQLDGLMGAIASSLGIFLPSFLFVLILNPIIPKMQKSKLLRGFLDAVNVAAIAVMLSVLILMTKDTIVDWRTALIALISVVITFWMKKVNVMWTIVGGAVLGYLFYLI